LACESKLLDGLVRLGHYWDTVNLLASGERTSARLGYRSGYYTRTLITWVGKLEPRAYRRENRARSGRSEAPNSAVPEFQMPAIALAGKGRPGQSANAFFHAGSCRLVLTRQFAAHDAENLVFACNSRPL
jgi:hypothetical protein